MRKTRRRIFVLAPCVALMLLLDGGVSWGRLERLSLSDKIVRSDWRELCERSRTAEIQDDYPWITCFEESSKQYKIPLPLLLAIARGESDFDSHARSEKECLGIMQIQWPDTAQDLGITRREDLFNPCINIEAGARYLAWLLDIFEGDSYLAVAAYNYGPNAVDVKEVPEGAKSYVAYVQRHLQHVLSRKFTRSEKMLILEFTSYRAAERFADFLKKEILEPPIEIFKSEKYTYGVFLTCETSENRDRYLKELQQKTGIRPLGRVAQ